MTALRSLPAARVEASARLAGSRLVAQLHNSSTMLAFQLNVSAQAADGSDLVPAMWTETYIELLP